MAQEPDGYIREEQAYWIMAEYPSKSNPSKSHAIRVSKKLGTLYCSCPACGFSFHRGDGTADCKHLRDYLAKHPSGVIVKMNKTQYEELKRAVPTFAIKKVRSTDVKRGYGEGL
jgi:hypothetical protein